MDRFNLDQIEQNARDLREGLDTIAKRFKIPSGPGTLSHSVIEESLAMAARLQHLHLLAKTDEDAALKELARWSVIEVK